jgi:L-ascorbate metabolism protein UlaG (beta-lactamase superfamily)
MADDLRFRWLGTAGIELESGGERILIDPYLSRFPLWNAVFGRPIPKRDLVTRYLSPARAVLVSHSHFDHLLDVPAVCREFGSVAYGSPNTCDILRAHEIPAGQIKTIHPGDAFPVGPFEIRIFAGKHGRMLGLLPYTGRLPARLNPPLRLSEYRMDSMLSFHLRSAEGSILIWNGPVPHTVQPADALFFCPLWGARLCAEIAKLTQAKIIVPVHWDDFFSPLDRSLHSLVAPPGWHSPWIRRMEPHAFARSMKKLLPDVPVYVPDIFKPFNLSQELRPGREKQ